MDRNTTIAFVLIGGILVLWLYLNSPEPVKQPSMPETPTSVDTIQTAPPVTQDAPQEPVLNEDSLKYGKYFSLPSEKESFLTVENNLAILQFSSRGANLHKYFLKEFNNWYSAGEDDPAEVYNTKVQLINYTNGNAYDLAFVSSDGKAINTGSLNFSSDFEGSRYTLPDNDSLVLTYTLDAGQGRSIQKVYTIYDSSYSIKSDIVLNGMNSFISNNAYDLVWDNGVRFVEENSVDEANYSNASVFYGDEQVIVDADDAGEKVKEAFNGRIDWIGIRNKYFAAIIVPENPRGIDGAYIEGTRKTFQNQGIIETYSVRLTVPFKNTNYEKNSFLLYIGPVDYDILKTYGRNLEAIVDFGSFFGLKFIVRPIAEFILLPLFNFLHLFIPNYGFVIIVFSLIIKIVLYPLTKQSFQSMKKMQLLQPKMTEIKEKFKEDPQKMNKEMMKLYSTYGVNPAGGCFPLLLQMPIFIALWGLFQVAIDLRQQPFIFWINDLSRPDVIFSMPFKLPLFGVDQISGLALLMGITTFVQQKMSIKDPKQQALIYIMPVMLTIMFMSFPSGLNLYYFMFNVFSIAQQYYINHKHDGMVLEPVKNPKKKSGFMQRMMDAAEQNAKVQQKKKR
ncbi:MAG: membrane protein insertase YidC [Ignavibacteriaceae bacterium]